LRVHVINDGSQSGVGEGQRQRQADMPGAADNTNIARKPDRRLFSFGCGGFTLR
jgi:hypothetical protein